MSILNKLAKYRQASTHEFAAKVPMSPEQAKALNLKMREENRINVSIARFGEKALVGTFAESATVDPEFVAWINHPSNAKIKKATADLFDTGEF